MIKKTFSGSRVLVAIAIGLAIGCAIAYFLKVLIENTPAEIECPSRQAWVAEEITHA